MSKMMKALERAEALKEVETLKTITLSPPSINSEDEVMKSQFSLNGVLQVVTIFVFLVVGITSIIFNFKTVSELKSTNERASALTQRVEAQTQQLGNLNTLILGLREDHDAKNYRIVKLEGGLEDLKESINDKDREISDMVVQNNLLKIELGKLLNENSALSDRYMELDSEFKDFKTLQEQRILDEVFKEDVVY